MTDDEIQMTKEFPKTKSESVRLGTGEFWFNQDGRRNLPGSFDYNLGLALLSSFGFSHSSFFSLWQMRKIQILPMTRFTA
jgi:hypothetical protein